MRASSEHTLRGQAELALGSLQARLAALEDEAAGLRAANAELFQAKSDAEEQRDSAARCPGGRASSRRWQLRVGGQLGNVGAVVRRGAGGLRCLPARRPADRLPVLPRTAQLPT